MPQAQLITFPKPERVVIDISRNDALLLAAILACTRDEQIREINKALPIKHADIRAFRDIVHAEILQGLSR